MRRPHETKRFVQLTKREEGRPLYEEKQGTNGREAVGRQADRLAAASAERSSGRRGQA